MCAVLRVYGTNCCRMERSRTTGRTFDRVSPADNRINEIRLVEMDVLEVPVLPIVQGTKG
jgi:hypothetical protein